MMQERKCFVCGGFGHITHHCRNMENRQEKRPIQRSLNKFEVLKSRVINIGEGSVREIRKDKKIILGEKRLKKRKKKKKEKTVEVRKVEGEKILRKVTVKIKLKQKENEEGIIIETLLDSGVTGLMMSLEFARKDKFRKKKLDRLICYKLKILKLVKRRNLV